MDESFSSGRHHHVKESLGHLVPVRHKRGRDIQGQRHGRALELEANSILWAVVFRPLLSEESKKPRYMPAICMCKSSVLVMLYKQ